MRADPAGAGYLAAKSGERKTARIFRKAAVSGKTCFVTKIVGRIGKILSWHNSVFLV